MIKVFVFLQKNIFVLLKNEYMYDMKLFGKVLDLSLFSYSFSIICYKIVLINLL